MVRDDLTASCLAEHMGRVDAETGTPSWGKKAAWHAAWRLCQEDNRSPSYSLAVLAC